MWLKMPSHAHRYHYERAKLRNISQMAKNNARKSGKSSGKKSSKGKSSGIFGRVAGIVTLVALTLFVVAYIGAQVVGDGFLANGPSAASVERKVADGSQSAKKKASAKEKKSSAKKKAKKDEKTRRERKPLAKETAKKQLQKRAQSVALANLVPERDLRPQFDYNFTAQVIEHEGYVVSYNADYKVPNWVLYELTLGETLGNLPRTNNFAEDPEVPEHERARLSDYRNSGYDRGHMAPNADLNWSTTAQDASFYLSNMCPQGHDFNAGIWLDLENQVRVWAERDSAVTIVCGPVLPRTSAGAKRMKRIGKGKVLVPELFWKVVLMPYGGDVRAIGFVMPNHNEKVGRKNRPISEYAVTVDSVERLTGIDFFPALPDNIEDEVESNYNIKSWF